MINHSLHRSTHHLCPTIACVAIGLFSAVPAQAQGETQCTVETPDGWLPLPGVSSFSASVTQFYAGTNPCLGGTPCSGGCHSEVGGLVGLVRMSYCRIWFPITDPKSPQYPGYWCEPRVTEPLHWFGVKEAGAVRLFEDGGYTTTGSAEISFVQPVRVVLSQVEGWVSGGRVLSGQLYVNAGETVVLLAEGAGIGFHITYDLCPDTDLNGICDAYDDAARAFGDFDSSGSVDGADLATLLDAWGTAGSVCDISYNGVVDGGDLAFLLSRWGQGA